MAFVGPVTLSDNGVTLAPLDGGHAPALEAAAADGQLWLNRVTSVPEPGGMADWVEAALAARAAGTRFPFVVVDTGTGRVLGTTSYHDISPAVRRLEIGHTWYAASAQRTHVNTTAKLLLLEHAFESLGCNVVGWRTDNFNVASRRAIERLGAKLDGVIRGHQARRDGTIRDTVMYSVTAGEWPEVKAHLEFLLASHGWHSGDGASGQPRHGSR